MNIFLSENLRLLRQKYGYSLEALAEILAVSRQTIAKWEAEASYPDILTITKLASLYKVTLDELVYTPLMQAITNEYLDTNHRVCGLVKISETCEIRLHQTVMDMFHFQPGEKILLLADKKQGLALVKCSQFD